MGISSRDKRDIYYRLAKENGYRARSAYKLMHIDESFNVFNRECKYVVDLCSAPGSWSQICADRGSVEKVVSVDLLDIHPLNKTVHLTEDITNENLPGKIIKILKEKADLVLCDGAPDITGLTDLDEYYQNQLVLSALRVALKCGKEGSTFICKIFRGAETLNIVNHIRKNYRQVRLVKPISSRNMSIESFILAEDLFSRLMNDEVEETAGVLELLPCGTGPDPDMIVDSVNTHIYHKYSPIDPPYKESIEERRKNN